MSLRVRSPLPTGDVRRCRGDVPEDPYMNRLVKLVPAEAIGPFPFLMDSAQRLTPADGGPRWAVYFVAWILLVAVIVIRLRATSEPGRGPQWGAVLVAAVAFFIWVHVMQGDFGFELALQKMLAAPSGPDGVTRSAFGTTAVPNPGDLKNFVSNVALMAWTTVAPAVYRGEENPNA